MTELGSTLSDTVFFNDRTRGTLSDTSSVTKLGGLWHCLLQWQNPGDIVFFSDRIRGLCLTLSSSVTELGGLCLVFGVIGWAPMWTFDYVLPTEISRRMIKLCHVAEKWFLSCLNNINFDPAFFAWSVTDVVQYNFLTHGGERGQLSG